MRIICPNKQQEHTILKIHAHRHPFAQFSAHQSKQTPRKENKTNKREFFYFFFGNRNIQVMIRLILKVSPTKFCGPQERN